ncbi:MAG: hypothetical protein AB7O49_10960 [Sphingomonadales bacterium]
MRRIAVLAVAMIASAAPALAQFDPDVISDEPARPAPPSGPEVRELPLGSQVPASGDDAPSQGIYQQGLDTLDPSSPGILNEANGGFPGSMWQGSDRRALVALLPRMPIGQGSPAMRSLAERLLLSEARVPQGASKDVYDVFRARIDRLVAAGYGVEVADLFSRVPDKIADARLAHARVDALLLTGDTAAACDEALSANQRSEEASWLEAVAYCKLVGGDPAGAGFTADLLRETGAGDGDFFALLSWLSQPEEARGDRPALANDVPLTPLRLVMLKEAGAELMPQVLDQAGPMVLVSVANDADLPAEIRLEAAERAARAGAISARDLASAYAGATFDETVMADPLASAASLQGGRANALLYQAAMQAPDPVARLKVLQTIWEKARADGTFLLAARVNAEAAKALMPPPPAAPEPPSLPEEPLPPSPDNAPAPLVPDAAMAEPAPPSMPEGVVIPPELTAAARDIVRALLAADEMESASDWYEVVREEAAGGDPDATIVQAQIWPLMVVADAGAAVSDGDLDSWWRTQALLSAGDLPARGPLLLSVLEGLGRPVEAGRWIDLYGAEAVEARMPSLPVWRGLNAAAAANRLGETVLLSLVILGEPGPGKASPAVLADVLKALTTVGLEKDARALALEALIASGF